MSSSLDMSLDDLIRKSNEYGSRNSNFRGRGRGSVSVLGPDPDRRFTRRDSIRPNPYSTRPVTQAQELIILSANEGSNGEANLYISNLDYGVSGEDIKVLFTEVGELLRYSLHYDISGRSKGTAEVVYACQTDALAAIKRYNNIQLDGKPLKIELVGVNLITPVPVPVAATSDMAKPHGNVRRYGFTRVCSGCSYNIYEETTYNKDISDTCGNTTDFKDLKTRILSKLGPRYFHAFTGPFPSGWKRQLKMTD